MSEYFGIGCDSATEWNYENSLVASSAGSSAGTMRRHFWENLRHSGSSNQPWSRDLSLDQGWWEGLLPDRMLILDRLIDFSDGLILFIWQKVVGSCSIYLLTGEVRASVYSSPVICPESNQSVLTPLHWNPSLGWKPPVFIEKKQTNIPSLISVWLHTFCCRRADDKRAWRIDNNQLPSQHVATQI